MPQVLCWPRDDPNAIIDRAVSALSAGELVALPTDAGTELACSALHPQALTRLVALTEASANGAARGGPAIALAFAGQLLDWVPRISTIGMRLARRAWPGPLVLLNSEGLDTGLLGTLPDAAQALLKQPAFRAPEHDITQAVLRLCPVPVVLAPAAPAHLPPADSLGEEVRLIVDDADCPPPRRPTVLQVEGKSWKVVRPGHVSAEEIRGMTGCRILFVCTGNTCRSPLAEGLCVKLLAEHLGCAARELAERGYLVSSAGVAAVPGAPATAEAVQVARALGADLSAHRSQILTLELLFQADYLVAMTHNHLYALAEYNMRGGPEARLLAADGCDLPDPIGGTAEVYRDCAQQILRHLQTFVAELSAQEDAS